MHIDCVNMHDASLKSTQFLKYYANESKYPNIGHNQGALWDMHIWSNGSACWEIFPEKSGEMLRQQTSACRTDSITKLEQHGSCLAWLIARFTGADLRGGAPLVLQI